MVVAAIRLVLWPSVYSALVLPPLSLQAGSTWYRGCSYAMGIFVPRVGKGRRWTALCLLTSDAPPFPLGKFWRLTRQNPCGGSVGPCCGMINLHPISTDCLGKRGLVIGTSNPLKPHWLSTQDVIGDMWRTWSFCHSLGCVVAGVYFSCLAYGFRRKWVAWIFVYRCIMLWIGAILSPALNHDTVLVVLWSCYRLKKDNLSPLPISMPFYRYIQHISDNSEP